jgi:hypothetical protein
MPKLRAYFLIALLSLSILIIALSNAQPAYAPITWDSFQNLSNNAGDSFDPQIAVSGTHVSVVWQDDTPGNGDIFFRHSHDNGATWGARKNLSNNAGDSFDPQIAVSGTHVSVVWQDDTPGNGDIFFRASSDNGATWGARKNLSNNAGSSGFPQLAVNVSSVYVTWEDDTPGNFDIFFRASSDNGATWGARKNLSNNAGSSYTPQIAFSAEGNLYVTWYDSTAGNHDIFFRTSPDNGSTWDARINLSNNAGFSYDPRIVVSGDNVYVVWLDDTPGNFEIFFRAGTNPSD